MPGLLRGLSLKRDSDAVAASLIVERTEGGRRERNDDVYYRFVMGREKGKKGKGGRDREKMKKMMEIKQSQEVSPEAKEFSTVNDRAEV